MLMPVYISTSKSTLEINDCCGCLSFAHLFSCNIRHVYFTPAIAALQNLIPLISCC